MPHYKGRIVEILLEAYQNASALIAVPAAAVPKPGEYIQAHREEDTLMATAISLFRAGEVDLSGGEAVFAVSGPVLENWLPGTELILGGPLGHGFELLARRRRIALVASSSPGRLLSLIRPAIRQGSEIALFCDAPVRELPPAVEVRGLKSAIEVINWADFFAVDVELENVDELGALLGIGERLPRALAAQALVHAPMPCGGLAKCGVCAFSTGRGERLPCEDGPVFELRSLLA